MNTLTGVGTSLGKNNLQFMPTGAEVIDLVIAENLYNFDGLAARIVNAVPRHALRQGFTLSTGDSAQESAILHTLKALRLPTVRGSRGHGGGSTAAARSSSVPTTDAPPKSPWTRRTSVQSAGSPT